MIRIRGLWRYTFHPGLLTFLNSSYLRNFIGGHWRGLLMILITNSVPFLNKPISAFFYKIIKHFFRILFLRWVWFADFFILITRFIRLILIIIYWLFIVIILNQIIIRMVHRNHVILNTLELFWTHLIIIIIYWNIIIFQIIFTHFLLFI